MMLRTVEMFLFDTCTHKCAYCHFAESGKVFDQSQMRPYRDPAFIDQVVSFFNSRTSSTDKWLLTLTGGEPLLMPNLSRFGDGLGAAGNKLAFYTALLVGEKHPGFRYLLERAPDVTDYVMASFHPEAEDIEDSFFERIRLLKNAGHSVIFRFVGHPERLHRLQHLSDRCRNLDVAFHATPLFSPEYPSAYSMDERALLLERAVSLSQVIQLNGGIDTVGTRCTAGSSIISVDMRTGQFTPCISVASPVLGNIYDDELTLLSRSIACPRAGISCLCDIHFQQNVVYGADDSDYFADEKVGFVQPIDPDMLEKSITSRQLRFSAAVPGVGQTATAAFQALSTPVVKAAFEANRPYYEGEYAAGNHPTFKARQALPS